MKVLSFLFVSFAILVALVPQPAKATTCTATGFIKDGINMTAAVIDPLTPVTGDVDATGCNNRPLRSAIAGDDFLYPASEN